MKINWSLMNRLGFNEPEDEFARFTPQGAGAATQSGNSDTNTVDEDEDDDSLIEDEDDDDDLEPVNPNPGKAQVKSIQMNPEDLIRQVSEATARSMRQAQDPGQPQLTEEDIQKRLGRPLVAEELIAQLRNPEVTPKEAAAALQQLLDGSYRYAMTSTHHLSQAQLAPFVAMQEQFNLEQQQKREVAFRGNLIQSYPALKKYDTAVSQAMAELTREGFSAKGLQPAQVYKTVAQRARKIIRGIIPDFSLKQQQASSQHRQAGSLRVQRGGQGNPGPSQAYGAASFANI